MDFGPFDYAQDRFWILRLRSEPVLSALLSLSKGLSKEQILDVRFALAIQRATHGHAAPLEDVGVDHGGPGIFMAK